MGPTLPTRFVGRARELALLRKRLDRVTDSGAGTAVAIRGRRQVGKSRLVQEFCNTAGVPYLFFTATKGASPVESVNQFIAELRDSGLTPDPTQLPEPRAGSWPDAFRILASALPAGPSIVVLDELPWLAEQEEIFDGALQTAWDRGLSGKRVVLLLLGSDLHMMERLTSYNLPFFGRADNLALGPLNLAEIGDVLGLSGADAIDAHLLSGGLPGILRAWPHGTPALDWMREECTDPASPLFWVPETALLAEFPASDQARRVLEAVGSGDRTYANIAATAGDRQGALPSGSLSPVLRQLVHEKRVLAIDEPRSVKSGKPALYRISDTNLRFYLAAGREAAEWIDRGRPEAAFRLIERRWPTWRGRAVEPLVRDALELAALAGELPWPDVETVGGWWNRRFDPEVDLVGADRSPIARRIFFAGSIKWLGSPFDAHDLAALHHAAPAIPGFSLADSGFAVVSLSGLDPSVDPGSVDLCWGPDDVVAAFRS